jgi:hypothetical protein
MSKYHVKHEQRKITGNRTKKQENKRVNWRRNLKND